VSKIAGLLLAAGTSSRMGTPKQLLQAGGQSLLRRTLDQALHSDLELVALVLGFRAQEIMENLTGALKHAKLRIVENKNYGEGISTSIVAGLSAVEEHSDHVMIILADMPHVTSSLINLLIRRTMESRLPLGAIITKNRRSHPVVIGRRFYEALHHLRGDTGARELFVKYPDQLCLVEPEEDYEDVDIDTLEDYLEFKKSLCEKPPSEMEKSKILT
jgi:molybdenum cofactor cytidylyltransferase